MGIGAKKELVKRDTRTTKALCFVRSTARCHFSCISGEKSYYFCDDNSTLLIVDDDIEKHDWLVRVAKPFVPKESILDAWTTEEAIELILKFRSLLAGFVDNNIPEKDGSYVIRTWREIEKSEGRDRASIALYTGAHSDTFEECKHDALRAGADTAISGHNSNKNEINELNEFLQNIFKKE